VEYTGAAPRGQTDLSARHLMSERVPARISPDGTTATWNPALTRAVHVVLVVRGEGGIEERRTLNSGRARVRSGERIEAIRPSDPE
jgi:hypothetical protein